jgi:hypothetical protein
LKYLKLIQCRLNSQESRSTEILRLIYINIVSVEVNFAPPSNVLVFRSVLRVCADNVHSFVCIYSYSVFFIIATCIFVTLH